MKYIKILWTIILNIVTLFVVLTMIEGVSYGFEKIVISILIIIYLSISAFYTQYSRNFLLSVFYSQEQFNLIKKSLKIPDSEESKSVTKAKKKIEESNIHFYINISFSILIYIIMIFNLLSNI